MRIFAFLLITIVAVCFAGNILIDTQAKVKNLEQIRTDHLEKHAMGPAYVELVSISGGTLEVTDSDILRSYGMLQCIMILIFATFVCHMFDLIPAYWDDVTAQIRKKYPQELVIYLNNKNLELMQALFVIGVSLFCYIYMFQFLETKTGWLIGVVALVSVAMMVFFHYQFKAHLKNGSYGQSSWESCHAINFVLYQRGFKKSSVSKKCFLSPEFNKKLRNELGDEADARIGSTDNHSQ